MCDKRTGRSGHWSRLESRLRKTSGGEGWIRTDDPGRRSGQPRGRRGRKGYPFGSGRSLSFPTRFTPRPSTTPGVCVSRGTGVRHTRPTQVPGAQGEDTHDSTVKVEGGTGHPLPRPNTALVGGIAREDRPEGPRRPDAGKEEQFTNVEVTVALLGDPRSRAVTLIRDAPGRT